MNTQLDLFDTQRELDLPTPTPVLYECGICSCYHPWTWAGDCRDDRNRYGSPEDYAAKLGVTAWEVEVRAFEDRMEADRG